MQRDSLSNDRYFLLSLGNPAEVQPQEIVFSPPKRTLHYELIIKKLKPNVLHGFPSTQTVHTKPAIFSADFSKIQHLSEKEKWSNKGCILDMSDKRREQQLCMLQISADCFKEKTERANGDLFCHEQKHKLISLVSVCIAGLLYLAGVCWWRSV